MSKLWAWDQSIANGFERLIGVDEAGRGTLAGPVMCAAVVLNYDSVIDQLNDSKKLSPKRREALFRLILENAIAHQLVAISEEYIDEHNILQATFEGMRQAILPLAIPNSLCLVDGPYLPFEGGSQDAKGYQVFRIDPGQTTQEPGSNHPGLHYPLFMKPVINGDALSACIAAASILAKVSRDRLMSQYHTLYPQYGFDRHKGYGTAKHLQALRDYGPCPIHRKSFAPVKNCS